MTKGYRTSEFWLTLAVMLLGTLMASGMIGPDHWIAAVVGMALAALKAMGYTAARAKVKQADSLGKSLPLPEPERDPITEPGKKLVK